MKLVLGFIYRITNKVNGKVYIGQTINSLKQRFHKHINSEGCKYLHNAILKHGKENFVIEEIERVSQDKLDEREIYWIKYYNSTDRKFGYNIYPGGNLGNLGNYKLSPQQISEIVAMEERKVPHTEIAEQFDVVPSQINYVIKTRFNIQNGYLVESKRGGGGYIRIAKVNLINNVNVIDDLINYIGDHINARKGLQIIQSLYEDKVLTKKEANLILAAIDSNTLSFADKKIEDQVRARILISILNRLRCKE